ncbi:MAG: hypothetical protein Q4D14_02220 [Bacteroidales bacterium]|nr:hypothetical protein [Bacteroidales bacterium]
MKKYFLLISIFATIISCSDVNTEAWAWHVLNNTQQDITLILKTQHYGNDTITLPAGNGYAIYKYAWIDENYPSNPNKAQCPFYEAEIKLKDETYIETSTSGQSILNFDSYMSSINEGFSYNYDFGFSKENNATEKKQYDFIKQRQHNYFFIIDVECLKSLRLQE